MAERWTAEEYREYNRKQARKNKYKNVQTTVDRITFDSKAEAHRYIELKQMLVAGEIRGFTRQPSFIIGDGPPSVRIRYKPDFLVCGKDGEIWAEDVKGHETPEFKLKYKIWQEEVPWLDLRIIR